MYDFALAFRKKEQTHELMTEHMKMLIRRCDLFKQYWIAKNAEKHP